MFAIITVIANAIRNTANNFNLNFDLNSNQNSLRCVNDALHSYSKTVIHIPRNNDKK